MSALLVAPIALPLSGAALCLFAGARPRLHLALSLGGTAATLCAGLALMVGAAEGEIRVAALGGWVAPFGIALVADLFGSLMVAVTGLLASAVALYSWWSVDPERIAGGYFPLLLVLVAGVCGAFLAGDLFNLFVWFEVLLVASFALLTLGGSRGQLHGGLIYVSLNLLSSALFLTAAGLVWAFAGTLNFADLGRVVAATRGTLPWLGVASLLLIAFGIKAAIFPLFFWLPEAYHAPPVAVTALFAGLMSKVGLYALLRVYGTVFGVDSGFSAPLLLVLGCLTMVTGVLGAVAQYDLRRLLAFHIISQVGYILAALGLASRDALAAGLLFLVHIAFAKSALILMGGVAEGLQGSSDLKGMGGLYRDRPAFSALFLVPALSLAGIPPLSGFFAKFAVVQSALNQQAWIVAACAMAVGLLTLFSMVKIWREAFWKAPPSPLPAKGRLRAGLLVPCVLLGVWSVLLGIFAGPSYRLSRQAADQILDRAGYQRAVLEGR